MALDANARQTIGGHIAESISLRNAIKLEEAHCKSANFGIQTRSSQT